MALYTYRCTCGAEFDRVIPWERSAETECACGRQARRTISRSVSIRYGDARMTQLASSPERRPAFKPVTP